MKWGTYVSLLFLSVLLWSGGYYLYDLLNPEPVTDAKPLAAVNLVVLYYTPIQAAPKERVKVTPVSKELPVQQRNVTTRTVIQTVTKPGTSEVTKPPTNPSRPPVTVMPSTSLVDAHVSVNIPEQDLVETVVGVLRKDVLNGTIERAFAESNRKADDFTANKRH